MRKLLSLLLCLFFLNDLRAQTTPISGYTKESAETQASLEEKFDGHLKASNLDAWMKHLTARPHHLGSAYGKQSAEYIRDLFKSWGYDAELETYKVLFPTPKVRLLELVSPVKFKASLKEPSLKEDATSNQSREQLPTYNAWSADGDVTGELVFVNYGVPDDYEQLERMGIDVKGKIVIAKYGGSWRGIKPKLAQEHGAIGCLIYSDPKEDGYYHGDVYPKGAFKGEHGVQRGSVMDLPVYPGDPITPGIGATPDAKRIDRKDLNEVITLLDNMRESTDIENRMVKDNYYVYAKDPKVKFIPPATKDVVPYLDFSALQNAMLALKTASATYSELIVANPRPLASRDKLNKTLYRAEQKLMVEAGLPRRPWYKHTIYAPGYYTGYGVKTLPGIREAIEQRNWTEAQEQIGIIATAIERYTKEVEAANKMLMMR